MKIKARIGLLTITTALISLASVASYAQVAPQGQGGQQQGQFNQQQQGGAINGGNNNAGTARNPNGTAASPYMSSRSRTRGQKVEWFGQDLVNAELAVGTARGACRSFSRLPSQNGTQRTREETSAAYQECMRARETSQQAAGPFLENNGQGFAGTSPQAPQMQGNSVNGGGNNQAR